MIRSEDVQRQRNSESRLNWDFFAGHRDRVTRLALRALHGRPPGRSGRLCVLGAGNCNDLDLSALRRTDAELHLVDLDGQAMTLGVARQGLADDRSIRMHPGLNLADGESPEIRSVLQQESFDAVVSCCLLSQLIEPVIAALGSESDALGPALRDLRRAHLALLLDLLVPGGSVLLISDLVSSDTVPGLVETPVDQVKTLMTRLIEARNFFSGANPFAVMSDLRDDPALGGRIDQAALVEPWIWRLSEERSFLVYAIALRRSLAAARK